MGVNTATTPDTGARRSLNLVLATWVSAINFWAWNMIGPLYTTYASDLSLGVTEASMLVATPILVGSLGRIVIGSLTDRFEVSRAVFKRRVRRIDRAGAGG